MTSPELNVLLLTAVSISVLHTITGPDHYLPFIAIGKTKGWKLGKTLAWTGLCGVAHVMSSVALALIGAALGYSLQKFSWVESIRGGLAGWSMLFFGVLLTLYGLWNNYNEKKHKHFDVIEDDVYVFEHDHNRDIVLPSDRKKVTLWVLFIIFLLGPCEPLIPLLTYQGIQASSYGLYALILVFLVCTIIMMMVMVSLGYYGISLFNTAVLEKHMGTIAGATILICGLGMVFFEW